MPLSMLLAAMLVLAEAAEGASSTQVDDALQASIRNDFAAEERLARKGDPEAQTYLSAMYHDGRGTTKDSGLALLWLERSAKAGWAKAQTALALRYKNGEGVAQNDRMAARWFQRAAVQKDNIATIEIAGMYQDGKGVLKNLKKALYWYANVADEDGSVLARQRFAEICASHPCTSAAKMAACKYVLIDLRLHGSDDASRIDLLRKLESGMTPEQIESSQRLASAWKADHPLPLPVL